MKLFTQFLRRWLLLSIAHKIQFFSLLLTSVIILVMGSVAYTLLHYSIINDVHQHIDNEAKLTTNKLQFLFRTIAEDINKLSLNTLVTNSLVDSSGRESYLLPFLQGEQDVLGIPVKIVLVDFQGEPIATNNSTNNSPYMLTPDIEQALNSGVPVSSVYRDATGTMLRLVKPIIFTPTQQTEGCVIVFVKLEDVFSQSVGELQPDFYAQLSMSGFAINHQDMESSALSSAKFELMSDFSKAFPPIKFIIEIGQDKEKAFAYINNLSYIFMAIIPILLCLVFIITGRISKQIAGPIIVLNRLAGRIADDGGLAGALSVPTSGSQDEVGQLTQTFNLMLSRLKSSYDNLEKKVRDRTSELQQSESRFRVMADNSPAMIWTSKADLSFDYYNQHALDFTARSLSELQSLGWLDFVHPADREKVTRERTAAFKIKQPFKLEYRLKNNQGEYRTILESGVTKISASGDFDGYMGLCIDITSRIWTEEQLRLAAAVFEKSSQGIIICDKNHNIISVNNGMTKISGYQPDEILSKKPRIFSSANNPDNLYSLMWNAINETGAWQGEVWNKHKNGKLLPEWLTVNVIKDDNGNVTHYIGMYSDISERKKSEQRITHLAYHDSLTGLPNRMLFKDRLDQTIASAQRHKRIFALLYLDIDHFKVINDSLGHDAGDELLKAVAQRLTSTIRKNDTVARVGGDEFLLLIEDVSGLDDIVKVIDKIMAILTQPYQIKHEVVYSSPSIGIAVYPNDSERAVELVSQADIAMYQAKAMGRSTFVFYKQWMNDETVLRTEIERELHLALERDELHVYLQPQIEIKSGKIIGAEALVRWINPDKGLIPPAEFIPVAEACGLIFPIGKFVLNQVLNAIHTRQAEGRHCVPIAVNISAVQFSHHNFLEQTAEMIERFTFDRNLLEFEITESTFIKEPQRIAKAMQSICAMGIRFSLDDFGTGYSSLSYLRQFPVSTLKIDQSFIRDLSTDKEDATLTVAIINMAHSLGLKVIAEGVETIEQERFLLENQCETGQGYLYAKPMPMDDFFAIIDSQSSVNLRSG